MRAAWAFTYNLIDLLIPNGLSLYTLGAGLLAAAAFVAMALVAMASRSPDILLTLALLLANLTSAALAARMRGDRPPTAAFRFFHVVVAACAGYCLLSCRRSKRC